MIHPTSTSAANKSLFISRELDGKKNWGALEYLTTGTNKIAAGDAGTAAFNSNAYAAANLWDKQADITLGATTVSSQNKADILCGDDMYVAGDPMIGGKGNKYASVDIAPRLGITTFLKDGCAPEGRGITVNAFAEKINAKGDVAYTKYGAVITDDHKQDHSVLIEGGTVKIKQPNGTLKTLLPGQSYIVGDPNDPAAKIHYATLPGQNEPRLVMTYYEKPNQATIDKLVAQGVPHAEAAAYRTPTTASFGFRYPDGGNASRLSQGTANGQPLWNTPQGVKTYYDTHWIEGECRETTVCPPEPPKPPVAPHEMASIWGDPHVRTADNPSNNVRVSDYNFQQVGTFNVLTDSNLELQANFIKHPNVNNVTVTDKSEMLIGGKVKMAVNAEGQASLVGQEFVTAQNPTGTRTIKAGDKVTLKDGSVIEYADKNISVKTPYEFDFRFETQRNWQGNTHMDIVINSKTQGVAADGKLPTGLLGESFDEDDVIERAPKGTVDSYRRTGIANPTITAPAATGTPAGGTNANQTTPPATTPAPKPVAPAPAPKPVTPPASNKNDAIMKLLLSLNLPPEVIALFTQLLAA